MLSRRLKFDIVCKICEIQLSLKGFLTTRHFCYQGKIKFYKMKKTSGNSGNSGNSGIIDCTLNIYVCSFVRRKQTRSSWHNCTSPALPLASFIQHGQFSILAYLGPLVIVFLSRQKGCYHMHLA